MKKIISALTLISALFSINQVHSATINFELYKFFSKSGSHNYNNVNYAASPNIYLGGEILFGFKKISLGIGGRYGLVEINSNNNKSDNSKIFDIYAVGRSNILTIHSVFDLFIDASAGLNIINYSGYLSRIKNKQSIVDVASTLSVGTGFIFYDSVYTGFGVQKIFPGESSFKELFKSPTFYVKIGLSL